MHRDLQTPTSLVTPDPHSHYHDDRGDRGGGDDDDDHGGSDDRRNKSDHLAPSSWRRGSSTCLGISGRSRSLPRLPLPLRLLQL